MGKKEFEVPVRIEEGEISTEENMVNMMQGEVCDSDGNFNLGGEITFPENPGCSIVYELNRFVKGFFDTAVLNVGNVDDYEQWEYETENGETVLLARNGDKALIIADKEKLEKIADSLDFRSTMPVYRTLLLSSSRQHTHIFILFPFRISL